MREHGGQLSAKDGHQQVSVASILATSESFEFWAGPFSPVQEPPDPKCSTWLSMLDRTAWPALRGHSSLEGLKCRKSICICDTTSQMQMVCN